MIETKPMEIQLPPALMRRLEVLAGITHQSVHDLVVTAIEYYLISQDRQALEIQEAVKEADSPDAVFLDHADVVARLRIKNAGK